MNNRSINYLTKMPLISKGYLSKLKQQELLKHWWSKSILFCMPTRVMFVSWVRVLALKSRKKICMKRINVMAWYSDLISITFLTLRRGKEIAFRLKSSSFCIIWLSIFKCFVMKLLKVVVVVKIVVVARLVRVKCRRYTKSLIRRRKVSFLLAYLI